MLFSSFIAGDDPPLVRRGLCNKQINPKLVARGYVESKFVVSIADQSQIGLILGKPLSTFN